MTSQQNAMKKYFEMVKSNSVEVIPGEKIQFASTTPQSALELVSGAGESVMIDAYIEYPTNTVGPVPVVVILNCGETLKEFKELRYAKAFREAGYATLIVNSFATRHFAGNETSKFMAYRFAATVDAFKALDLIAKNPRIDSTRVGVVAWANAGPVALTTAIEDLRIKYTDSKLRYSAAIAIQPLCSLSAVGKEYNTTPVLIIEGELDESSNMKVCHTLVEQAISRGGKIHEIVYAGAVHQWDAPISIRYVGMVYNFSKCNFLADLKTESMTIGTEATPLSEPDLNKKMQKHFMSCFNTGARWGGDEFTRNRAMTDVTDFFKKSFKVDLQNPANQ